MKRRTWTTDDQLTSDLVHTRSLWRVMDCVVNWKKRLYKINRRKLFVYGLHNQLNIAVCDDACSSSTFRPNHPFSSSDGDGNSSVKDGVALDGQVTLLAYRYRGEFGPINYTLFYTYHLYKNREPQIWPNIKYHLSITSSLDIRPKKYSFVSGAPPGWDFFGRHPTANKKIFFLFLPAIHIFILNVLTC